MRSIAKLFRVSAMVLVATLFLVAGLTAVSAQTFKPRSETATKICNAKYDQCLKDCKVDSRCKAKCGPELIACGEAAETPREKEENKARDDKESAEMQRAAAQAAKFECAGRGTEMVIYATNKTLRTLTCDATCKFKAGNGKDAQIRCPSITVGPESAHKEVCSHSNPSQPPPFKEVHIEPTPACH